MQRPDIKNIIYSALAKMRVHVDKESFALSMYESFFSFHHVIEHIGEIYYIIDVQNKKERNHLLNDIYYWNYLWPFEIKKYLILWRNSILELNKSKFIIHSLEEQKSFQAKVFSNLNAASCDLIYSTEVSSSLAYPKAEKVVNTQINPWRTYLDQYNVINNQISDIQIKYVQLKKCPQLFHNVQISIFNNLDDIKSKVKSLKNSTNRVYHTIINEEKKIDKLVVDIDSELFEMKHLRLDSKVLINNLDNIVSEIPTRLDIPFQANSSRLFTRDIDLSYSVDKWLGSEILPLIYEVHEIYEDLEIKTNNSFINAKNQISILQTQNKIEIEFKRILISLEKNIALIEKQNQEIDTFISQINKRFDDKFSFISIFNTTKPFLGLSNENNSYKTDVSKSPFISLLVQEYKKARRFVSNTINRKNNLKLMTPSERLTKCLQCRVLDTNGHYANIFLTKGYTAQSFWIKRNVNLNRIESAIKDWNNGYKGGALLIGNRYCGKTVFGEMVLAHNKHLVCISIQPNSELEYAGRKLSCSYDLDEVLSFIKKNSLGAKVLIWIDDLEKWRDKNNTIFKNFLALSHFINENNKSFFCMVSMSNLLWARINAFNNESTLFNTIIKLDTIYLNELISIINLRHGATHMKILNHNDEEIPQSQINQHIEQIWNYANGNLGDALNAWVYSVFENKDNEVSISNLKHIAVPRELVFGKRTVLIKHISMLKMCTDYELNIQFGHYYAMEGQNLINAMLSEKLLVRRPDQLIEINEVIHNEVVNLLTQKTSFA